MKPARKLEQLATLRRRRAERTFSLVHASLLEAEVLRARLEEESGRLARRRKAWQEELATANVIRRQSNREAGELHARVAWMDMDLRKHDTQRHAHAQEIDRLEGRKADCLREIGRQDALRSVASKRRRAETTQRQVAQDEEDADEYLNAINRW
ncbi:hypothetical protein [Burkholderia ubonensis]|uniref:hypothetical protein n=1 Tax=Burkholderia ubonensis TaxID=101571 RepID=UPI0012FAC19B|nr:hypothetical protein [Burkholderia ubonensis]